MVFHEPRCLPPPGRLLRRSERIDFPFRAPDGEPLSLFQFSRRPFAPRHRSDPSLDLREVCRRNDSPPWGPTPPAGFCSATRPASTPREPRSPTYSVEQSSDAFAPKSSRIGQQPPFRNRPRRPSCRRNDLPISSFGHPNRATAAHPRHPPRPLETGTPRATFDRSRLRSPRAPKSPSSSRRPIPTHG